ncbi:hypothetical protein DXH78_03360 [Undibacter mobilis]|uniref:Uncharacterized protein n=2 Tax=Undibacter mobilis TaxID=2292256 RepID=A0A371B7W7_9BRAD|nr:hypothetical protein DXH78_03360 [Undibacter mobilis]
MMLGTRYFAEWRVVQTAHGALLAAALLIVPVAAFSQDQRAKPPEEPGLFESIGRWFDNVGSSFKDAGKGVENLGREAGVAAKSTVEGAKDAAGAVARIPAARVVTGHEKCRTAPNGAPDCVAAATAMCKARGFESGKSADMTTAEVCPAQVYLSGRSGGSECRTETFVSRALCQ